MIRDVMDETTTSRRPLARKRRGAATLEFALVLPIFIVIFFGLVELGRAMMVISLLNNAARDGCRAAILTNGANESATTATAQLLQTQGIQGHTTTVLVNNQANDVRSAITNDLITVRVSVPFANVSWLPGVHRVAGDLLGQYTLPKE